jgi:hypothetical protein
MGAKTCNCHIFHSSLFNLGDTSEKIENVVVWQPYGWFAHLVIKAVTGPESGELEDVMLFTRNVRFMDGTRQAYDYWNEMAWVEMYNSDYIDGFVRRGALRDPKIMLELGRGLFAKLESQIQELRNQSR